MKDLYFEDSNGKMHEILSEALVVRISPSGQSEIQVVERRVCDGNTNITAVSTIGRLYNSVLKDL